MLTILYDSTARASEITKIRIGEIRLQSPANIVLHGKGSKDRIVPLSVKTAALEVYTKADGKSKRAVLDAAYSAALNTELPALSWNDDNLMRFLTDLCGG